MRRANIFTPEFDQSSDREGYRWRAARVGKAIEAEQIGGAVYEVAEGERTWPFHVHHGVEEWLVVLAGSPTLREAAGERVLRPGDTVCFPSGPEGAHQLRGPGTVLLLSTNSSPPAVSEYLDSGKVGVRPPGKLFRLADEADYWEGE